MKYLREPVLNINTFERTRMALGPNLERVFAYMREDGEKAIRDISKGIRENNAAALVLAAHSIKGAALHLGAQRLATLAGQIEYDSRDCVELRIAPTQLIELIAQLKPVYDEAIAAIAQEVRSPTTKKKAA